MKIRKTILFPSSLLVVVSLHGQILPSAVFPFEKLRWGQSIEGVSKILNRTLIEVPEVAPPAFGPFSNFKGSGTINYSYDDTIWGKPLSIMLSFSKEKLELTGIMVSYFGIDPRTKKAVPDAEKQAEFLWQKFTERFGKPQKSVTIPFQANGSSWSFPHADVGMALVAVGGRTMLTVNYSPKKK
jgi:hypothetical protein